MEMEAAIYVIWEHVYIYLGSIDCSGSVRNGERLRDDLRRGSTRSHQSVWAEGISYYESYDSQATSMTSYITDSENTCNVIMGTTVIRIMVTAR